MEEEASHQASQPLNLCHVQTKACILNRTHTFLHSLALLSLIHFRLSHLIFLPMSSKLIAPIILHLIVFSSELLLSFMWLLCTAFGWRPVQRTVFPERLPDQLPAIDVFICTTDPEKEPTLRVMNTVLSAMALDYPPEKLNVYVSDDGGFSVTLRGLREVWLFAKSWVPFCRTYGIRCGCPEAYFSEPDHHHHHHGPSLDNSLFIKERQRIQQEYELFKEKILEAGETKHVVKIGCPRDHTSLIEVIEDDSVPKGMPLLYYVAREKRPTYPHHFKAGALNALLRVSGIMSNSPYILVLDCDMYCNDISSAKLSMCFHLDPKMSRSLAFVQFPQRFHNISKNDIYDSQLRSTFKVLWPGQDGLGGPILSGTGFYIKREALYHYSSFQQEITEIRKFYGTSKEFIMRLHKPYEMITGLNSPIRRQQLQDEARCLASCTYEEKTKWGEEVGFMYGSVVEDFFTGMMLHCKGWTSVYLDPPRPQFLGNGVTSLSDMLVQGTRWSSGLVDVALSKYNPIRYDMLSKMPLLQAMCYAMVAYLPFYSIPLWCFATIPQLCLLNGISLYPQVSSSWSCSTFILIFLSSNLKYLHEVLGTGGSIKASINETRIWMIKGVTCQLYGTVDGLLKKIGAREASFMPTNKVLNEEQVKLYHDDKFNFQASDMFVGPLVTIITLNAVSLIYGLAKALLLDEWDKMFMQVFISLYITVMGWPVIEAMLIRNDKGRIGPDVALKWTGLSLGLVLLGPTLIWATQVFSVIDFYLQLNL